MQNKHHHNNPHVPVLLDSVVEILAPNLGESYLDLTAGYGGHAREIINQTKAEEAATLVDRDAQAQAALKQVFPSAQRIHESFARATKRLVKEQAKFDMILIDFGVASPHLDIAERGFSFSHDGPLDMRMDQKQSVTAEEIVNTWREADLAVILREYGEEKQAKRIAAAIVEARPLKSTTELAEVVSKVIKRRPGQKIHPATRTFQALRIVVNDELGEIDTTLPRIPDLLEDGGRVAIISFHSLEDRRVKRFLTETATNGYDASLRLVTKKPISGATEDVNNPRARSAKLRAAVKIKT